MTDLVSQDDELFLRKKIQNFLIALGYWARVYGFFNKFMIFFLMINYYFSADNSND